MVEPADLWLQWDAHATAVLVVHLVWATRDRGPWLEPRLDAWLAKLLERKAWELDCCLLVPEPQG